MNIADVKRAGIRGFVEFRHSVHMGGSISVYPVATDRFIKYLFEDLGLSTEDVTCGKTTMHDAVWFRTPLMKIIECSDNGLLEYLFARKILATYHYPLLEELCDKYPYSVEVASLLQQKTGRTYYSITQGRWV
jgi:hypothetical protein